MLCTNVHEEHLYN